MASEIEKRMAERRRERESAAAPAYKDTSAPSTVGIGDAIGARMREKIAAREGSLYRDAAGARANMGASDVTGFYPGSSETKENPSPSGWQNAWWVPQGLRDRANAGEFTPATPEPNERQATYDALREAANALAVLQAAENAQKNPYGYNWQYAAWVPQKLRDQENARIGKTQPSELDYVTSAMRSLEADAYESRVRDAKKALDDSGLTDAYAYLRKAQAYKDWQQTARNWQGGDLGEYEMPQELAGFKYDKVTEKEYRAQLAAAGVDYDTLEEYDARQARAEEAAARRQAWTDDATVLSSLATVAVSPLQGLDLLNMLPYIGSSNSRDLNTYTPMDPNQFVISDYVNTVRGAVSKKIEEDTNWEIWGQNVASFAYQTGMSMADSAVQMAMFGPGATYVMGMSAAANGARETLENGGTNAQAFWSGLAQGTAEALFEHVSIENLLKQKSIDGVGRLVKEVLKQAGTEASEEVFTEITNIITDAIIMGDNSERERAIRDYMAGGMSRADAEKRVLLDNIRQVVLAGVGGAISGGVMGGVANSYQFSQLAKTGREIRDSEGIDVLLDTASKLDKGSDAYARGQQVSAARASGQTVNNATYGALDMEVRNEQALRDRADVVALSALMYEREDGRLPRNVQQILDENPYAAQRYAEIKARQQARTEAAAEGTDTTAQEPTAQAQETASTEAAPEAARTAAAEPEYSYTVEQRDDGKYVLRVTDAGGNVQNEQVYADAASAKQAASDLGLQPSVRQRAQNVRDGLNALADGDEMGNAGRTYLMQYADGFAENLSDYYRAYQAYYDAGLTNGDYYEVQAETGDVIPDGLKSIAYKAGQYDRKFTASEEIAKQPFRGNGLHKADYAYAVEAYGVQAADRIQEVAKRLGVEVRFSDLVEGGLANASIDGRVILMEKDNPHPVFSILGHEWTHRIQDLAPEAYGAFRDSVKGELGEAVEKIKSNYQSKGKSITDAAALDEAVADYAGQMLSDGRILDEFLNKNSDKPKVIRWLLEAWEKIKAKLTGAERKTAQDVEDKLRAALEAAEKAALSEETQAQADGRAVEPSDVEVKHSLKNDKDYMDAAIKTNSKTGNVSERVMNQAAKDRAKIQQYLQAVADMLPPDIEGDTFYSDSSYGGSEENTTVCVRSLAYEEFMDAVAEALGRPLTVEDTVFIAQEAMALTDKPECLYCYVAMDRKAYREFIGKYLDMRDQFLRDVESGMDVGLEAPKKKGDGSRKLPKNTAYGKMLNGSDNTQNMYNRAKLWMETAKSGTLITRENVASIARMNEAAANEALRAQIEDANAYAQSASWAKKKHGYAAYNNHILKWTAAKIAKLNKMYGMRMYSFSDFSPAFILENMQMITDAAVKGLKVLGYTKELDFVRIFAPTGMNINISVFGYDDGKGGVAMDAMQGADWAQAQELRAKYGNVGCTFVATNDAQVEWALAQDWIDVVIPFHLVRTGSAVAKMFGWTNYTDMSSDKKADNLKGKTPHIFPYEHQNDKATFLQLCEKKGLTPRFAKWVDNPNYMKLVNETRQSEGQTMPVQPVFDVAPAQAAIDEMVKRGGYMQHIGGTRENMEYLAGQTAERVQQGESERQFSLKTASDLYSTKYDFSEPMTTDEFRKKIADENSVEQYFPKGLSPEFVKAISRKALFARPKLYRGIEAAEFDFLAENGYLKSNGSYNFANQKGQTLADEDAGYALSYATGFAPQEISKKHYQDGQPTYLVEFVNNPNLGMTKNNVQESYTTGQIDSRYITRVFEIEYDPETKKDMIRDVTGEVKKFGSLRDIGDGLSDLSHGLPLFYRDKTTGTILYAVQDETGKENGRYISEAKPGIVFSYDQLRDGSFNVDSAKKYWKISGEESDLEPMTVGKDGKLVPAAENDEARMSLKDMTIYNRTAVLNESTVDKYLADYAAKSSPKYARAYIARMSPEDFVKLTTSRAGRQIIEQQTDELDAAQLEKANVQQPIQLNIDHETGEISGHEGRHRALALARAGVTSIPVLLFDSSNKYGKTPIDSLTLTGQDFGSSRSTASATIQDLQPLSYANRDTVVEQFTTQPGMERVAENYGRQTARWSMKSDTDYLAAVERGDMETAQRMVDEAAKAAGYTTMVYHGTSSFGFTRPEGMLFATDSAQTAGTYSGTDSVRSIRDASGSSLGTYRFLANTDGMLALDANGMETSHIALGPVEDDFNNSQSFKTWRTFATINQIIKYAREKGYTGVIIQNTVDGFTPESRKALPPATDYVFFNPQAQVKSADPVTYDDAGDVIPLSERFNPEKTDIRWSLKSPDETTTTAQLLSENKRLAERVAHFKGQLRLTKDWTADEKAVRRLTRSLLDSFDAQLDREAQAALAADVKALVEYAHRNTGDADYETRMQDMAYGVARSLVKNARVLSEGSDVQLYNEVKRRLREPMIIDSRYAHDIAQDKWGEWRTANRGKVNVSINGSGIPVDVAYKELSEAYPWLFPENVMNPADQVLQMLDAIETLTPVYENPYSADMAYAIDFAANGVLDAVMDDALQAAPTFADRKKAQIQQERKANWEYTQEMIRRERAKRDEQIQRIMDYHKAEQQRRAERRADSEARTRLLKIAKRLQNKKLPAVTRALLDQYIGDLDTVAKSITGAKLDELSALRDWYEQQKATDPDFIADPSTEKKLERLYKRRISELSATEVAELTEILLNIENELANERRIIDSEDRRDTRMMALESIYNIDETQGSKKNLADWVADNTLSPLRLLRRLTGYVDTDPLYQRTRELADGQRKMLDYQMRAERLFSKWANDTRFIDRVRRNERIKITGLENGNPVTVEITPDMRMALYLHSLHDQNMRHIAKGGVTIPDIDLYLKGDLKDAYARGRTIQLSPSNVRSICAKMSEAERAYARAAHDYFNGMSRDEVNATSEKLVGYSIASVEDYFPIETDRNFTKSNIDELKRDGTIEGMGFLKERVNASNAINLVPLTDVLKRSIQNHAKYVGLAIPIRNYGKLWGMAAYNEQAGDARGLRQAIGRKWGSRGVEAIENMITDLQSAYKRADDIDKLFGKIRSNYAAAVLSLNLSVAMKQAASYPTAAAVLGWWPLAKAMKDFGRVDLDLIAKYTPLQWYRSKGYSTQELGDIKTRQGVVDKALNAKVKVNGHEIPLLNWIQSVDVLTTRKLWKASEYYVRQNNKDLQIGSEEYYRAVADIYNRVIEETQPNYTTMQRPQLLRSQSAWAEMLGMFKTQPFQNFNVLYDAIGELRAAERMAKNGDDSKLKSAKTNAANAISSQIVQLAVFAAMTALWGALRKKDDKWRDKEGRMTLGSVLGGIGKDMISGAASMIPAGSDIYNVVESTITGGKYYGASSVTVSAISDAFTAIQKAFTAISKAASDPENISYASLGKAMENLVLEGSKALGVPAENIRNNVQIVMRYALRAAAGEYVGDYEYIRLTENMESSYVKGDVYDNLYRAYMNDPKAHKELYDMMVKDGFKPDNIKNAMEKRMKEAQGVKSVSDLTRRYSAP